MMTPKLNIAAFFVLATFNISFVVCIHQDDYIKLPTGNCYKFYDNEQWNHGAEKCTIEGGMMYYPNNEQELETVFRELNMSNSSHLHVGYLDPEFNGRLMTVDGRRLTHVLNKWAPGEPKLNCSKKHLNLGDCSCVQIGVSSHEISIIDCYKVGAYICNHRPNRTLNAETGQLEPICPKGYTYIQVEENYYKYYPGLTSSINWYNAKVKCESDGAELFHPDNLSELEQVFSGLRNTSRTTSFIFAGFSNLDNLGEFKTIDGRLLHDKYQKWDRFHNTDPNDEWSRCGVLLIPDLYLSTYNCLYQDFITQDFICKRRRPAVKETENNTNAACGEDYDHIPSLRSCYKYHNNLEHWNTSIAICQLEGGDLFHPENEQELNPVLTELGIPDDVILFAGFSDLENHGVYKTVKGRLLEQAFKSWVEGGPHPESCSGNCHCGKISVHSRSVYIGDCPLALPFVCKRAAVQQ